MDYQTLFTLAFWLGFLAAGLLASVAGVLFCLRGAFKSLNQLSELKGMIQQAESLAEKTMQELKDLEGDK